MLSLRVYDTPKSRSGGRGKIGVAGRLEVAEVRGLRVPFFYGSLLVDPTGHPALEPISKKPLMPKLGAEVRASVSFLKTFCPTLLNAVPLTTPNN